MKLTRRSLTASMLGVQLVKNFEKQAKVEVKQITFEGVEYNAIPTKTFSFDDIVSINGNVGYVEFIGAEEIVLVLENSSWVWIPIVEIKDVLMLRRLVEESGCLTLFRMP
jgi:hypothetical protein